MYHSISNTCLTACLIVLMMNLANAQSKKQKVVFVIGTSAGVGKATAEYFIKQGHIVYGADFQFEKNKYLNKIGGHSIEIDVNKIDAIKLEVKRIINEHGKIDMSFNMSGSLSTLLKEYKEHFGDIAYDEFILKVIYPPRRQSITFGSNGLSYVNSGYDFNYTYNRELLRLGINYTEMDYSNEKGIKDYRSNYGLFVGAFINHVHTGLNIGIGFNYANKIIVSEMMIGDQIVETINRDLYQIYFRTAWLWDFVNISNTSIFIEPGFNLGYGFGNEVNFLSGRVYENKGLECTPFITLGTKITL